MEAITPFPEHLQTACDEAIAAFNAGKPEPKNLETIKEWLKVDGWDALTADLEEQMAVKLRLLAGYKFEDAELRNDEDIPDEEKITDDDRVRWGHSQIDQVIDDFDEYFFPSVHAYELTSTHGDKVIIGCLVDIQGQAGAVCHWQGLWPSRESFWQALGKNHENWLVPLMGDVPDEVILSLWQKKKRSSKQGAKTKTRKFEG